MLLQIQEATKMMGDLAELGPLYKLLIAIILVLVAALYYVFRLYVQKVESSHQNEKSTLEVLGATNEILRSIVTQAMTKEEARLITQELSHLRDLIR